VIVMKVNEEKYKNVQQATVTVPLDLYEYAKDRSLRLSMILAEALQERKYDTWMQTIDDLRLENIVTIKESKKIQNAIEEKFTKQKQAYLDEEKRKDIIQAQNLIKKLNGIIKHLKASMGEASEESAVFNP